MEEARVTSAVLVEKDGKFLLGKRSKANYNGKWVIPGGGIRFGESIQQAGLRELKEETNLDADVVKLIGHKEIINIPGNYHRVVFYHLAKPIHMEIVPSGDISEARFFSIEEIKSLDTAESVEWVLKQAGFWRN